MSTPAVIAINTAITATNQSVASQLLPTLLAESCTEETAVIEQINRFATQVLAARAAQLDEDQTFATCHLQAMSELGLMGTNLPVAFDGIGLAGPALYRAVELIAGACGSTASMLTAHFLATDTLHLGGDTSLHNRFLDNAANGKTLGAFALTEPESCEGVHIAPAERTMGLRGGHVFGIAFDCRVPVSYLIGPEGSGFKTAMKTLDNGRI